MIAQEYDWIGFTADIYGKELHGNVIADYSMEQKIEVASKYQSNPELFNGRIQAAIDALKEHPNVDSTKIALVGTYIVYKVV